MQTKTVTLRMSFVYNPVKTCSTPPYSWLYNCTVEVTKYTCSTPPCSWLYNCTVEVTKYTCSTPPCSWLNNCTVEVTKYTCSTLPCSWFNNFTVEVTKNTCSTPPCSWFYNCTVKVTKCVYHVRVKLWEKTWVTGVLDMVWPTRLQGSRAWLLQLVMENGREYVLKQNVLVRRDPISSLFKQIPPPALPPPIPPPPPKSFLS